MTTSPVHPSSKHNPESYPPPRLCGWSNQGDPRKDRDAKAVHETWIRHTPKKL